MEIFDSSAAWKERAYYFCGKLNKSLVVRIWRYRTEDEYDAEIAPEVMATSLISRFSQCVCKRAYLMLASSVGTSAAVRSKKGVLWGHKDMQHLPNIQFEIECGNGKSRLVAVVDLSQFGFDYASKAILNWGQGVIILSNDELTEVKASAESWISKSSEDVLAYNYDEVSATLSQNTSIGILRYLPPGNNRTETVVLVADVGFVTEGACKCIVNTTFPSNK